MGLNSTSVFDQRVYAQNTAPQDTRNGNLWADTSFDPPKIKVYSDDTATWEDATPSNVSIQNAAPSGPSDGDVWVDTSAPTPVVKTYDADAAAWVGGDDWTTIDRSYYNGTDVDVSLPATATEVRLVVRGDNSTSVNAGAAVIINSGSFSTSGTASNLSSVGAWDMEVAVTQETGTSDYRFSGRGFLAGGNTVRGRYNLPLNGIDLSAAGGIDRVQTNFGSTHGFTGVIEVMAR